ncbi:MAG: response regulator transcription factor [Pseudomonadota bacterium]|nr:response regulator transcription factor [Pseudomonadota bacterium]
MKIGIVEDEEALREHLAGGLRTAGYSVEMAGDGEEGLYLVKEFGLDLVVIDLGLPKMSGLELIKTIRESKNAVPILVLTARGNWQDKVEALEIGADDYVVKPFQLEEIIARINALLRRSVGLASPKIERGPIVMDTVSQQVTVEGAAIELTSYEYKILEYLMMHPQEVISKTKLTDHIYEQDFERDSNVIEVFIGRLRKKIDPNGSYKPIETLRGRGYRFSIQAAAE